MKLTIGRSQRRRASDAVDQGPFTSLKVPAFRGWFIGQVLSVSGLMTQTVAAAWLVLELTGRAIDLSLLVCATFLPVLFGSSWGGALIDRFDHRRLLIFTQSAFLLLSASLFLLTTTGRIAARSHGQPSGRLIGWLALSTAASVTLTAFAPGIVFGLIGMALSGMTSIWYIAAANTLVQLRAAPEMRGRVMGVWAMALPGATPVTSVLAAVLADWVGVRITYAAVGLALAVTALAGRQALLHASEPKASDLGRVNAGG
jgi:MFS family permease